MSEQTLQFTKIKRTIPIDEDTVSIESRSYTDNLSSYKEEQSKDIKTSPQTILKDVIACLDVLDEGIEGVTICIRKYKGEPNLITKTWTVKKEYYGK